MKEPRKDEGTASKVWRLGSSLMLAVMLAGPS